MNNTCDNCRFWSEMLAFFGGGEPLQAMCLEQNRPRKYTKTGYSCEAWKENTKGAIDDELRQPDYSDGEA